MKWVESNSILKNDRAYQVRQVYVWAIDERKKFLIVSKDGNNWQLPGGKPNKQEQFFDTAIREMNEETGVDIAPSAAGLTLFGYYLVKNPSFAVGPILQMRLYVNLDRQTDLSNFHTANEDSQQAEVETIKFIKLVDSAEAVKLIPWLSESGEYKYLKFNNLI